MPFSSGLFVNRRLSLFYVQVSNENENKRRKHREGVVITVHFSSEIHSKNSQPFVYVCLRMVGFIFSFFFSKHLKPFFFLLFAALFKTNPMLKTISLEVPCKQNHCDVWTRKTKIQWIFVIAQIFAYMHIFLVCHSLFYIYKPI